MVKIGFAVKVAYRIIAQSFIRLKNRE